MSEKRERRCVEIAVRLTPKEHIEMKERAAQAGMTLARFCRESGLRRVRGSTDQQAISQLVRVGNLLNQQARLLHFAKAEGNCSFAMELDSLSDQMSTALDHVLQAVDDLKNGGRGA